MIRKAFKISVGLALVMTLLAVSSPARAGERSWKDAVGDSFPGGANTALDITQVNLSTSADSFIWRTQVKKVGDPIPLATGHHYTLSFAFADANFIMRITQDRLGGNGVVFQKQDATTPTVQNLGCAKCKVTIDPKTNTLTLTATLGTMQAASRKLVAGAKVEKVNVFSGLMWATPVGTLYGASGQGDSAPPGDEATFTF